MSLHATALHFEEMCKYACVKMSVQRRTLGRQENLIPSETSLAYSPVHPATTRRTTTLSNVSSFL